MKKQVLGLSLLLLFLFCAPARATHIQYFDYADVTEASFSSSGDTWSWTFSLTADSMKLWDIDDNIQLTDGSYNPAYALHYVTLRINPNNYTGGPTSNYIDLKVNGIQIKDWENPIRLYDWGVPGGSVSDKYGIASIGNNYEITIDLYGLGELSNLATNKIPLKIDNVNLEGCFDVPEPATLLLLGLGLVGLAGVRRKFQK